VSSALRISEATSLALHTMVLLAADGNGGLSSREIASSLNVSQAHLQKVLQRLGHSGLVRSERGPKGGFTLARPADEIALLEVYESIEGPLSLADCLFDRAACRNRQCILGDLISSVNGQFSEYLRQTRIAELADRPTGTRATRKKGD